MICREKIKKHNVIFILFSLLLLAACLLLTTNRQNPIDLEAKNGFLDLTSCNIEASGPIELDGKWEFYWDQLLNANDFKSDLMESSPAMAGYVKVPAPWNGQLSNGSIKGNGYATYRLLIKVDASDRMYGIKTTNIRMAHKIYINGYMACSEGNPAPSAGEGNISRNVPGIAFFQAPEGSIEILVQVSNMDFYNGGIIQNIYFGTQKQILQLRTWLVFLDLTVIISLLITCLYYLSIYLGARKDRGLVYFGLMTLILAFITATGNEKLLIELVTQIPFVSFIKARNIAVLLSFSLLCLFIRDRGRHFIPRWFYFIYFPLLALNFVLVIVLPLRIYSRFDNLFQTAYLLAHFLLVGFFVRSLMRKEYGSLGKQSIYHLLLSVITLIINYVSAVLYLNTIIHDTSLVSLSMILFLSVISMMLSRQYSKAYETIEGISQRLLELDKLKDEFLANTSHELKTPLNGIINITSSILEAKSSTLSTAEKNNLAVVAMSARRLQNLINDILDISSLKNGQIALTIKPIDLRSAAEVVVYVINGLKGDKPIKIINNISSDLPPVNADIQRLRQIFYNLLGNALKFTQQGKIEVGAELQQDYIEVWVEDTGCGIPANKLEDIFNSFYQVDSSETREAGGTGLGLSISKRLVELHSGSIWASSEIGKGARFTFRLPVSQGPKNDRDREEILLATAAKIDFELPNMPSEAKGERKYAILVADDDPASLTAAFNIFESEGYYVKTVGNGEMVLEELEQQPHYNLVILDVMMPKMSGYEVLRKIRQRFQPMDLPVLLLTAKARPEDLRAGLEAGANDYLTKPFEAIELKARVRTLVQLKDAVNELIATELSFLQAQIKPHFIFNSLSVIASLSTREPERAKGLLYDLSDYLRGSFIFENFSGLTPLSDEVVTVKAYLSIEKARFQNKLNIVYDIDESLSVSVPMLTIQPLVENAVRHGILKKPEGGTLTLRIRCEEETAVINVIDDGVGIPPDIHLALLEGRDTGKRVGLKNVHKRLRLLYGTGLEIISTPGRGTSVSIRIPRRA